MSKTAPPQELFDPLAQTNEAQKPQPDDLDLGDPKDDIQKGMAPRNIKRALVLIAAAGVMVYMFWPTKPPAPPEPPAVVQTNNQPDQIVNLLERQAEDQRRAPQANSEGTSGFGQNDAVAPIVAPAPPMPSGQATEQDERVQLALISSMAADGVAIRSQQAGGANSPMTLDQRLRQNQLDIQAAQDRIRRESQADFERVLASSGGGAAAGAPSFPMDPSMMGAQPTSQGAAFHQNFINAQGRSDIGSPVSIAPARHPNTLYEGTLIRTVTTRHLNTTLPGIVTAKVTSDLYDSVTQKTLLIPRGSEVTCRYQSELRPGQKRLLMACNRLRLPTGESFALSGAVGSGLDGMSGIEGKINNHFWEMFGTSLVVGAASYLLPREDRQINVTQGDSGNDVGGTIMGTALRKVIDEVVARNTIIGPTGEIPIGTPFTLTLSRDVEFASLHQGR